MVCAIIVLYSLNIFMAFLKEYWIYSQMQNSHSTYRQFLHQSNHRSLRRNSVNNHHSSFKLMFYLTFLNSASADFTIVVLSKVRQYCISYAIAYLLNHTSIIIEKSNHGVFPKATYNNFRVVHCIKRGVSGYILKDMLYMYFFL